MNELNFSICPSKITLFIAKIYEVNSVPRMHKGGCYVKPTEMQCSTEEEGRPLDICFLGTGVKPPYLESFVIRQLFSAVCHVGSDIEKERRQKNFGNTYSVIP